MSIDITLFNHLKTVSAVTDIFGSGDNIRIYPRTAPDAASTPYAVYFPISRDVTYSYEKREDAERLMVQYSVFGSTYSQVRNGADAIMDALEGCPQVSMVFHESEILLRDDGSNLFHIPLTVAAWK